MKSYEIEWNQILYKKMPFTLRLIIDNDNIINNKQILINDDMFENELNSSSSSSSSSKHQQHQSKHIDIIIEWKDNNIYNKIRKVINKVIVDPEYSKWKKQKNDNNKNNIISLYDCIDSYTSKKKINDDDDINCINNNDNNNDLYFCNRCKKHQKATQKIDLYSFPKYLIIHLQRKNNENNNINNIFVDYPIKSLNLTKYITKYNRKKNSMDDDIKDDIYDGGDNKENDQLIDNNNNIITIIIIII